VQCRLTFLEAGAAYLYSGGVHGATVVPCTGLSTICILHWRNSSKYFTCKRPVYPAL